MKSKQIKPANLASKFRQYRGQWVLFLGSAISRNAPSNLPLAREFKELILRALTYTDDVPRDDVQSRTLLQGYPIALLQKYRGDLSEVPFEVFLEQIIAAITSNLATVLLSIYAQPSLRPNFNHRAISLLIQHGFVKHILTTNFDVLLEKSLQELNVEFNVVSETEDFEYAQHEGFTIYKLHGSVAGFEEDHRSLLATMQQVGQGLPPEKERRLREFLEHYHVLFVGYGGRDYDLLPVLQTVRGHTSHVWAVLSPDNLPPVFSRNEANDQLVFTSNNLHIKESNIFARLLAHLLPEYTNSSPFRGFDSTDREFFAKWAAHLTVVQRLLVIAYLCQYVARGNLKAFKRADELEPSFKSGFGIGQAYRQQGKYEEALRQFLTVAKKTESPGFKALALDRAAHCYKQLKDFQSAQKYFLQARALHRLAKRQNADYNFLWRSYAIRDHNDLLINIARTAASPEEQRRRLTRVIRELTWLNRVTTRRGEIRSKANILHILGRALHYLGNLVKARHKLEESLNLFRFLHDKRGVVMTLRYLARVHEEEGHYEEAKKYIRQAFDRALLWDDLEELRKIVTVASDVIHESLLSPLC